jgi:serpin B
VNFRSLPAIVVLTLIAAECAFSSESAPALGIESASLGAPNRSFATDLYRELAKEQGNLFFAPSSLETALALAVAGAGGSTAAQIEAVLHLPGKGEAAHEQVGDLLQELNGRKSGVTGKARGYELSIANALWGQTGVDFRPAFLRLAKAQYSAGLREVDFLGETERARRTINESIAKETRDRIKELIPQGGVSPQTRMLLTNAVYFKGTWNAPFEKTNTRDEPFQTPEGGRSHVAMMHQTEICGYWKGDGIQALRLPYKGGELSLVVLLPDRANGLPRLEKMLSAAQLVRWLPRIADREVEVALPRIRMAAQFELSAPLRTLGMIEAFTPRADFSGLSAARGWGLSGVIHKTFLEINEEGTEAAAATGLPTLGLGPDSKPAVFRADHPFLFLIRHERSGAILFLGRLVDPAAGRS